MQVDHHHLNFVYFDQIDFDPTIVDFLIGLNFNQYELRITRATIHSKQKYQSGFGQGDIAINNLKTLNQDRINYDWKIEFEEG